MTITSKILIGLSLLIGVIALGVGFAALGNQSSAGLGSAGVGHTETNSWWFYNGLFGGSNQQFGVSTGGTITDTTGCLALGNASGTTSYVTISATSTLTISTTKPSKCL